MEVDEVSCIVIATGNEFCNLGFLSCMLRQGKRNVITRIITAYFPTVSVSTGGSYIQQLEALAIMIIQNDPKTQFWIDLNTDIYKWIHQGRKIILIGVWNSEA